MKSLAERERKLLLELAHVAWPSLLEIAVTSGPQTLLIVSPIEADRLRVATGLDLARMGAIGVFLNRQDAFVSSMADQGTPSASQPAYRIRDRDVAKSAQSLASVWIVPALGDPELVITALGAATRGLLS